MSKIILLNGAGSSGKTSIARSIKYLINEQWLTFGVDTFVEMTPYPLPGFVSSLICNRGLNVNN